MATETADRGKEKLLSSSLCVGLSPTATQKLLFKFAKQLDVRVDRMTLKVETDGNRHCYFNLATHNIAKLAWDQIKAKELLSGNQILFNGDTKISYSQGEYKQAQRDQILRDYASAGQHVITASFLKYLTTQEGLNELGCSRLRDCDFSGVYMTYHWSTKKGTSDLRFGACHAMFVFNSLAGAKRGLTKLREMKDVEKLPFFKKKSTVKGSKVDMNLGLESQMASLSLSDNPGGKKPSAPVQSKPSSNDFAIRDHNENLLQSYQTPIETADGKETRSNSLFVGMFSRRATPYSLSKLAYQLNVIVDKFTLKENTNGSRFAFLKFATSDVAAKALIQLEAMKATALDNGDLKLFTWRTKIEYSKEKPKTKRIRRDVAPYERRSVMATFMTFPTTKKHLDQLRHTQLRDSGCTGVSMLAFWSTNKGAKKPRFGAKHGVFEFETVEGAELGKGILNELMKEERCGPPWFFTWRSHIKWTNPKAAKAT